MKTAKFCVIWDVWTPRVTNKILMDLLTLKRFFRVKGVSFSVAAGPELEKPLEALGITYSPDFGNTDFCRVYIFKGKDVPEDVLNAVPQDVDYEVSYLDPLESEPQTRHEDQDPYGKFPLPYPGKSIPPTMQPRYYRPKMITEPYFAPFI